jgi:hypothetical protein
VAQGRQPHRLRPALHAGSAGFAADFGSDTFDKTSVSCRNILFKSMRSILRLRGGKLCRARRIRSRAGASGMIRESRRKQVADRSRSNPSLIDARHGERIFPWCPGEKRGNLWDQPPGT